MTYQRYSQRLLHIFILLILMLPYAPSDASVGIFLLGLASRFRQKPLSFTTKAYLNPIIIAFISLIAVGVGFSSNHLESAKTSFRMLGGVLAIYGAGQVMLYSSQTYSKAYTEKALWLLTFILIMCFLFSLTSCQYPSIYCGVQAAQAEQNKWSTLMLMMVCAHAALFSLKEKGRWAHILISMVLSACIIIIQGRGAFVTSAMVIGLALLLMLFKNNTRQLSKLAFYSVFLSFIAIIIMAGITAYYPATKNTPFMATIQTVLNGRVQLWDAAIRVIDLYPLQGVGIGSWKTLDFINNMLPTTYYSQVSPHNLAFDLITSVGLVGLGIVCFLVNAYTRLVINAPLHIAPVYRRLGMFILFAILLNGMVDFRLFATQFIAISGIGYLLWRGGTATHQS